MNQQLKDMRIPTYIGHLGIDNIDFLYWHFQVLFKFCKNLRNVISTYLNPKASAWLIPSVLIQTQNSMIPEL